MVGGDLGVDDAAVAAEQAREFGDPKAATAPAAPASAVAAVIR